VPCILDASLLGLSKQKAARKRSKQLTDKDQALATSQMIPAWLQFLKSHGLMNGRQHKKALNDVQRLPPKIIKIWEAMPEDPM
jgi:hypothetical protein